MMFRQLLTTISGWTTWWAHGSESQKQTRIAVLALLVAVVALLPVWNDLSASPEEKLVKLGYHKTYPDFWRAISNKHVEAVELFTKAGLRLEPRNFAQLFDDKVFNKEVLSALIKGKALEGAHCPVTIDQLQIYEATSQNPEKRRAMRDACATDAVRQAIASQRDAEQARIAAAQAKNAERPARLRQCVAKYQAEGDQRWLDETSSFAQFSVTTYSERQCVLAGIYPDLATGLLTQRNYRQKIAASIAECCASHDRMLPVEAAGVRAAEAALLVLK